MAGAAPASAAPDAPITVSTPAAGTVVSSPVTVTGVAHTFESTVYLRIRDSRGTEVSSGWTTAVAGGAYAVKLPYIIVSDQPGTVEVFEYSAKGDDPVPEEVKKVTVPVQLTARSSDRIAVFSPEAGSTQVSPLRLTGKARAWEGTVRYRVRGESGAELAAGFTTALNDGDPSDIFRGSFQLEVPFKVERTQPGTVELWEPNMSDEGPRELSLVKVPVVLHR
jgi:hypothetical protein